MKYIIGNWKANKTFTETEQWLQHFLKFDFTGFEKKVTVIICPPFPFIQYLRAKTADFPFIAIGSQDLSVYYEGAYTGEVTAKSLQNLVKYAIVGHSERRHYFNETNQIITNKVRHAFTHHIQPIFCTRGVNDPIPHEAQIIAYEPVSAIGTGQNEPISTILDVKQTLKLDSHHVFIYGGSVNEKNAHIYITNQEIDGVLVGGSSLDPMRFYEIINNC